MEQKYSGQRLCQLPQVREVLDNPHFCCFCILEAHVQGIINHRKGQIGSAKAVLPLSVILMI
jgi:hypothetical protein